MLKLHHCTKLCLRQPKIAVISQTVVFQSLELESKWVAAALSGRAALPGEEAMMAAVREDYRRMEEAGKPKRHTHALWPRWVSASVHDRLPNRAGGGTERQCIIFTFPVLRAGGAPGLAGGPGGGAAPGSTAG